MWISEISLHGPLALYSSTQNLMLNDDGFFSRKCHNCVFSDKTGLIHFVAGWHRSHLKWVLVFLYFVLFVCVFSFVIVV